MTNFIEDKDKMLDYVFLTEEEFLDSYSYLTKKDYDDTHESLENFTVKTSVARLLIRRKNYTFDDLITLYNHLDGYKLKDFNYKLETDDMQEAVDEMAYSLMLEIL